MTQKNALVIDDNTNDVEVLTSLLNEQNLSSTSIYMPNELATMLDNLDDFDLVFLDLEMPKLNGYQVFEYLRDHISHTVPIVAYTVHTSEINTARALGFHSFLGKPLDTDEFPEHLARILEGERIWIIP